MKIICAHCGKKTNKPTGHVNRSRKEGLRIFCNRKCAGLGRRTNKPIAQFKAEKRLYDMEYRNKNREMLKGKKHEYFNRTYNPVQAAIERKANMARHVEYCRRPEYKAYKKTYDRAYLAKKNYGDFGESILLLRDIENEIASRITRYEVYQQNGTLNKWIQRRKEYEHITGQK